MNLRNIVLGVVGLAILGYAGVYARMYMNVKSGVEDFAGQIALAGDFTYDAVSVSPLGSAFEIEDIRFTPHGSDDGVRVDAVRVEIEKMLELMNLPRGVDPDLEIPRKARVSLVGLRIPTYSEWLNAFADAIDEQLKSSAYQSALCGGHLMLKPEHYLEMGHAELVVDISVGFFHDVDRGSLNSDIEVTLRDLGRFDYEVVTSAPTSSRLTSFAGMDDTDMRSGAMTYTDLGLTRMTNEFCAQLDETTVEEYVAARVDQSELDYLMTWGFVPGEGIRTAYRRFLSDPQTVEVKMNPGAGFDPSTLHLYKASDIPQVLNLQVMVNGQTIEDLGFRTADEVELPKAASAGVQYSLAARLGSLRGSFGPEHRRAVDTPRSVEQEEARYHSVTVKDLDQHIGRKVKVVTTAGLTREGTLESADRSTIYVVRMVRGGRFTMPVPYEQVSTIEVFF